MNRRSSGLWHSARHIVPLAWPVLVGQLAVLAFSTIDTVMAARSGSLDLAALAVGGAAYISVFIGLMGVVLAVGPIAGQLFGAGRLVALRPALWVLEASSKLVLSCTKPCGWPWACRYWAAPCCCSRSRF